MVEKLSITVALEGGKAIERQLADIGKAGQKAFADIGDAADKAGTGFKDIKPEDVTAKLKELGITGAAEIQKIQAAVKQAGRLESMVQGIATVENAFAALSRNAVPIIGAIATAFVAATKQALAWADAVNKASTEAMKLGVPVEQLDKLRQGFERAGISSEAITDGLRKVKAGLDQLDVDRVKQAFDRMQASADGIGSSAMKALQAAAAGVGKAADDARVALAKLADEQRKGSLQADVERSAQAVDKVKQALANLASVPAGTPGLAREISRLRAQLENAEIAADRAKQAMADFAPSPTPLTGFAAALEKLGIQGGKLSEVIPQIVEKFRAMPDTAQRTALAFATLGDKMGPELIAALQTGSAGIDMFQQKWSGLTQAQAVEAAKTQQTLNQLSSDWDRFKAELVAPIAMPLLGFLRSELVAIQGGIRNTIKEFAKLGEFLVSLGNLGPTSFWNMLGTAIVDATKAVGDFIAKLGSITWDIISGAGVAAWNAISGAIQGAIGWLLKFIGLTPSGGGTSGETPPGMAGGGLLGGRGTGTSDSNLAWVSRGEHIMPARAVAQPGVLAFLEALRRSGGDLGRVLDRMGRFALGGPVGLPALAAGGGVGGMSHVTIQFPGMPAVSGLRASSDVVEELRKQAAMAQVRSGGRKPSRYT